MKKGFREHRPFQNSLCLSNQTQHDKIRLCAFILLELTVTKHFKVFCVWLWKQALSGWRTWRETKGFGKQTRKNQTSASGKVRSVKVFKGKLPDLLLPLVEAGWEPWSSGAPFSELLGVGSSVAPSYREAKPRTLIAFPNAGIQVS